MTFTLHHGDCLDVLRAMDADSVDACVTDPPYGLSFMGKGWDYDVPGVNVWREVLRVLKPGGHLLAFAGTRTQHRMAVNIEDAGFEIRDMIAWVYGSGFPKSLDVSKAIDKRGGNSHLTREVGAAIKAARQSRGVTIGDADKRYCGGSTLWTWYEGRPAGQQMPTSGIMARIAADWPELNVYLSAIEAAEREIVSRSNASKLAVAPGQENDRSATTLDITAPATDAARKWQGWGTALKPALEPITVARKPLIGTVAANVQTHGTGAINIDGCRIASNGGDDYSHAACVVKAHNGFDGAAFKHTERTMTPPNGLGRWPANLIHDGSEEVLAGFPETGPSKAAARGIQQRHDVSSPETARPKAGTNTVRGHSDAGGSAARFFYCAKASKADRDEGLEEFERKRGGAEQFDSRWKEGTGEDRKPVRANVHPTVKPTDLMRYLCRLVTPPDGLVLDPFAGSGSTGKAAILEGFRFVGIEREADYIEIARARVEAAQAAVEKDEREKVPTLFD